MCVIRICRCMPAMKLYKLSCCTCQVYIISGCVVVYAMCICIYVASVSISAGCGVFIVRICVYAKSLFVYIPVCNCINCVTIC